MLSAVHPLWNLMPDGALKRQLFTEIAERSQVGSRELGELWRLPRTDARSKREPRSRQRAYGTGTRKAIKPKTTAFAETIARLVLRHSRAWDLLTGADHEVLCGLQPPLGDLFLWIDAGSHEHGGQPWAALQVGMEGMPFAALAAALMTYDASQPLSGAVEDIDTTERDLRLSMLEIHLDLAATAIDEAGRLPQSDPSRHERLLALSRRQQQLLQQKRELRS
jgi:DNA primase